MKLSDLLFNLLLLVLVALVGFVIFEKYQNYQLEKMHQNDTSIVQSQQVAEIQRLKSDNDSLLREKQSLEKDKSDLMAQLSKKSNSPDYSVQINSLSARVEELSKKDPVVCPEKKDESTPRLWNRISELEQENRRLKNAQVIVRQEVIPKVTSNSQDKAMIEDYRKLDKYQKNKISELQAQNNLLSQKNRQCEVTVIKSVEERPVPVTTKEDQKPVMRSSPAPTPAPVVVKKPDQSRLQTMHKPLRIVRPDELPKKKVNTQVDELN